jgi:hypothetical protein
MRVWKFEVIFDSINVELNLLFGDKLFAKIKQNGSRAVGLEICVSEK